MVLFGVAQLEELPADSHSCLKLKYGRQPLQPQSACQGAAHPQLHPFPLPPCTADFHEQFNQTTVIPSMPGAA